MCGTESNTTQSSLDATRTNRTKPFPRVEVEKDVKQATKWTQTPRE